MELFFSPLACSLASHIVAREAGLPLDRTKVTLSDKRTADGRDFLSISPKGQVPVLRLDDGSTLTESAAILQHLADLAPASGLLPAPGTRERYAVLEWMSYVSTEIHKTCFYPMFSPDSPPEAKAWARGVLEKRLDHVEARMQGRSFVATDGFTVADAALAWALNLCTRIGVDFSSRPALEAWLAAMRARPAVRDAIAAEEAEMAPPAR